MRNYDPYYDEYQEWDEDEAEEHRQKTGKFLLTKGAMPILTALMRRDRNARFSDLNEQVEISSATLSKRLKEGRELGLWMEGIIYPDGEKRKVYQLTQIGGQWAEVADGLEVTERLDERREAEQRYEEALEEFADTV